MRKRQGLVLACAMVLLVGAGLLKGIESSRIVTAFVAYSPIQSGVTAMNTDALALRDEVELVIGENASVTITLVSNSLHRLVFSVDTTVTDSQVTQQLTQAISSLTQTQRQAMRTQLAELETLLTTHRQAVLQRKLEIETEAWTTDTVLMTLQQRVTWVEIQLIVLHQELDTATSEYQLRQVMITSPMTISPWLFGLGIFLGGLAFVWRPKRHA